MQRLDRCWRPRRSIHAHAAQPASEPAGGSSTLDGGGLQIGFSNRDLDSFSMGIMGDLHLEPGKMEKFEVARQQLRQHLREADPQGARIVQLGDVGGYTARPGSWESLRAAARFMQGFEIPMALVLGNHDLEGDDFDTDEANLAAWQEVFNQHHYWSAELGPALCIGMSTVRFRSNEFSVHEVHIDEEQLQWFEETLEHSGGRPVIVFTHAPPMGSGLQVVQEVHVKNRCCWLNHSSNPQRFLQIVERYPNIALHFSGHFHLSHNYVDSISVVNRTAFVQTGVIGDCNRDGHRQSRVLTGDQHGYQLYTLDHEDNTLRLDLEQQWESQSPPQPILHEDSLLCDPDSGGWVCSQLWCDVSPPADNPLTPRRNSAEWFAVGGATAVALQAHMLVEYDVATRSPIGLVCKDIEDDEQVVLLDAQQNELAADGSDSDNGENVAFIELRRPDQTARQFERNPGDRMWYRLFQQNKWQERLRAEREANETALAA